MALVLVVRTGYDVRSEVVQSSLSSLLRSEGIVDTAGSRSGSVGLPYHCWDFVNIYRSYTVESRDKGLGVCATLTY